MPVCQRMPCIGIGAVGSRPLPVWPAFPVGSMVSNVIVLLCVHVFGHLDFDPEGRWT